MPRFSGSEFYDEKGNGTHTWGMSCRGDIDDMQTPSSIRPRRMTYHQFLVHLSTKSDCIGVVTDKSENAAYG